MSPPTAKPTAVASTYSPAMSATAAPVVSPLNTSNTSSDSASSNSNAAPDPQLPLKLCLLILKSTGPEMQRKYNEYVKAKTRRTKPIQSTSTSSSNDTPLSYNQFLYMSTIRLFGADEFVFKKTELTFYMMLDSSGSSDSSNGLDSLIDKTSFCRYGPILHLCSPVDGERLYDTLTLVQKSATGQDGISYVLFKLYVDALAHMNQLETLEWSDMRANYTDLAKSEQLLCIRNSMLDSSSFPPALMRVGLTTNHLISESLILRRRRTTKWSDIKSIHRITASFLRSDSKFQLKLKDGTERILDSPGLGAELLLQRQRSFSYFSAQITAHRIAEELRTKQLVAVPAGQTSHPDDTIRLANKRVNIIANTIISEAAATIKRMVALESVALHPQVDADNDSPHSSKSTSPTANNSSSELRTAHAEPLLLDMFNSSSHDSTKEEQKYVQTITQLVNRCFAIKQNKDTGASGWFRSSTATGSNTTTPTSAAGGAANHHDDDIDPEYHEATKYDTSTTVEEVEVESFNVTKTTTHIKITRQLVDPLLIGSNIVKTILDWENPYVSGGILAFLLNIAWHDACSYIPALLVAANIFFILLLKFNPDLRLRLLHTQSTTAASTAAANIVKSPSMSATAPRPSVSASTSQTELQSPTYSPSSRATARRPSDVQAHSLDSSHDDAADRTTDPSSADTGLFATYNRHKAGLLETIKSYRTTALKGYAGLGSLQHLVQQVNFNVLRFYGLYCWQSDSSTQQYLVMLVGVFLGLWFIPFRLMYVGAVLYAFSLKWQSEGGAFQKMLVTVPIPSEDELFKRLAQIEHQAEVKAVKPHDQ